MNDKIITIAEIRKHIDEFCDDREWKKEDDARSLAMALSVETAELMEIFMWLDSDGARDLKDNPAEFVHLQEEIADVFWYLCRICRHYDIDLAEAVADKTVKNAIKYPVTEQK